MNRLKKKFARCLKEGDQIAYLNGSWRDIVDSVSHGMIENTIKVRINNDTGTIFFHKEDMVYVV